MGFTNTFSFDLFETFPSEQGSFLVRPFPCLKFICGFPLLSGSRHVNSFLGCQTISTSSQKLSTFSLSILEDYSLCFHFTNSSSIRSFLNASHFCPVLSYMFLFLQNLVLTLPHNIAPMMFFIVGFNLIFKVVFHKPISFVKSGTMISCSLQYDLTHS